VPNAPTIGTATDVGTARAYNNGAASVTFTAPTFDGGLPITSYTVTSSPGGFTGTGASSPITVAGLASSTAYTFTVTATNSRGTGAASAASNSVTATTVPQAPTIGTATAGDTSATVTYTAGATGGKTVSAYTATSSPGSLTGTGASPITVSSLTNGTAYTFTVTATNANGTSTASAASNSVTPVAATSYESIATLNGTGSSATISFTSIPSTYKHLQIRMIHKGSTTGGGDTYCWIRLNNSATNYSAHNISGDGATVSQDSYNLATEMEQVIRTINSGSTQTSVFSVGIIDIQDYSSTTRNKTLRAFSGYDNNGAGTARLGSGTFYNTTAVSSVQIIYQGGSNAWTTGSQFALYGIKG
jgi:hypothetical protein